MKLKDDIINLLKNKDLDAVTRLSSGGKKMLTILISLTYNKKNPVCWRAIEAIGLLTAKLAKSDPETVRNIVQRLLWMIRDESGGIGWSSPEILGEIVRNSPGIFSDIAPVILSFHDEQPLCAGVLRAAGRIGKINVETDQYAAAIITPYLKSPDSEVRGYAAWALGELAEPEAVRGLEELEGDNNNFYFYQEGEIKKVTVGEIAAGSLAKIKK